MIRKENTMSDLQKKTGNAGDRKYRNGAAVAVVFVLMLAVAAAGCGNGEEGLQIEAIETSQEDAGDNTPEKETGRQDAGSDAAENAGQTDEEQGDGGEDNAAPSVGNTEIEGDVRSLSADSFVICKHETWSEDGASFAAAAAPGYEKEEDMITVHVAENCVYEYRTVKNGGVSPEDVSTREGTFADLKERMSIIINGNWQDDGSFLADSIVMMEFV